jgi:hypothetical protein
MVLVLSSTHAKQASCVLIKYFFLLFYNSCSCLRLGPSLHIDTPRLLHQHRLAGLALPVPRGLCVVVHNRCRHVWPFGGVGHVGQLKGLRRRPRGARLVRAAARAGRRARAADDRRLLAVGALVAALIAAVARPGLHVHEGVAGTHLPGLEVVQERLEVGDAGRGDAEALHHLPNDDGRPKSKGFAGGLELGHGPFEIDDVTNGSREDAGSLLVLHAKQDTRQRLSLQDAAAKDEDD